MKNIKDIVTLNDLMLLQLRSMHDAELQWARSLEQTAGNVEHDELRRLLRQQVTSAREHGAALEGLLGSLGAETGAAECLIVRDLVAEINGLQNSSADPQVLHAGMIVTCQCYDHYMIARYGSVASFARLMGQELSAAMLHNILDEEKANDEALTRLAKEKINKAAQTALIS